MENNKEKDFDDKSMFHEDFKDFDEEENFAPEIDEDLAALEPEENIEEVKQETQQEIKQELQEEVKEEIKEEKDETEIKEETTEEKVEKIAPEFSQWEELNCENSVVKKYIFYVSKDFVPLLDDLNADERSAYINDAIQKKIDFEVAQNKIETKRKVTKHLITMIVTILLASPLMILFAHKAIMATFDNYKYSQENFEKLYRQRFEHDRAYMRSIQYNKEQREKLKNKK